MTNYDWTTGVALTATEKIRACMAWFGWSEKRAREFLIDNGQIHECDEWVDTEALRR